MAGGRGLGPDPACRRVREQQAPRPPLEHVHDAGHRLGASPHDPRAPLRRPERRRLHDRVHRPERGRPGAARPPPGEHGARREAGPERRGAAARPGQRPRPLRRHRVDAGARQGEGLHEQDPRRVTEGRRRDAVRHRAGGDPARPRPDLQRGPEEGRVPDRGPDRPADPAVRVRALGGGHDPVDLRRVHDHGHARRRLRLRARDDDGDVRDEPGPADRARDRDRLLAADRLPLPRGGRAERLQGRRDRPDDGDRGPRGRVLGRDGRDRARAAPVHALAVHALDGHRRLPDPARLDRRGPHAAARAALALRAQGRQADPGVPLLQGQAREARVLGAPGELDHESAGHVPRRRDVVHAPARDPGFLAQAHAGLGGGDPAEPPGGARLRHPEGRGRRGRALADAGDRRHRSGRRRERSGGPALDPDVRRRREPRPGGALRPLPAGPAVDRSQRPVRAGRDRGRARVRRRGRAAVRPPVTRRDHPGGWLAGERPRPRRRRPSAGGGLHRPLVRGLPVARARGAGAAPTCC